MIKSNKGITLVALVITIIVLLILAGVSISLVVGDNGIMTRAKTAGEETNTSDAVESFKLAVASLTSEYYEEEYTGSGTGTSSVADYVVNNISKELGTMDYSITDENAMFQEGSTGDPKKAKTGDVTVTISKTGGKEVSVSYTVSSSGNITNIKKASN